mmetsp:Transcript_3188/g.4902  ORF Transcript_3188/g.4902 Transcript_3188/m.4902 type:complete len:100 (-) Transcript_3188:41-340(-)
MQKTVHLLVSVVVKETQLLGSLSFEQCRELVLEYAEKEVPWEVYEKGGGDDDNKDVLAMFLGMGREDVASAAAAAAASAVAVADVDAVEETYLVIVLNG